MKIIYFLLLLLPLLLIAQPQQDRKRDYVWCFGYDTVAPNFGRSIIDFADVNNPSITYANKGYGMDLSFTYDGICDTEGKLQFYTNGVQIINADHALLHTDAIINDCTDWFPGAFDMGGYRVIQGVTILPMPGHEDLYYIFHVPVATYPAPINLATPALRYSIVDMNEPNNIGGIGKLIAKNNIAIQDNIGAGMLRACRHANGRDWWLLVRKYNTNTFYKVLLSPKGIEILGTQSIGETVLDLFGQCTFSPDGSKFAIYGVYDNIVGNRLHIYDFDRCTGELSNPITGYFNGKGCTGVGIAVSPNSQFLYTSESFQLYDVTGVGPDTNRGAMTQYDLHSSDILASAQVVAEIDSFEVPFLNYTSRIPFFDMQLGSDNKIYILGGNTHYMGRIENPDTEGIACNVNQHCVYLPSLNGNSMPNNPWFRLGAVDGSVCDSLGIDAYVDVEKPVPERFSFKLYPNPATDAVNVVWYNLAEGTGKLEIKDAMGRTVFAESIDLQQTEQSISLANMQAGVYFVSVYQSSQLLKTEKLIIIK